MDGPSRLEAKRMLSSVLSDAQIRRVHGSSLDILGRVGVPVPHPQVLGRFADAGAQVDHASQTVRIPGEVAETLGPGWQAIHALRTRPRARHYSA